MSVVSFEGFVPPARYDSLPWTSVRIEEASVSTGPWALIDTFALSPVDSDPSEPMERDFTTENATLTEGWYRLIFVDATADTSLPSDPIQNVTTIAEDVRPSQAELGSLMRARTRIPGGTLQGYFGDNTNPTGEQAREQLDFATDLVLTKLGMDIAPRFFRMVRRAILLKAAALIELTYYPEQANDDQSAYSLYQAQYTELIAALTDALLGNEPGGSAGAGKGGFGMIPIVGRTGYVTDANGVAVNGTA